MAAIRRVPHVWRVVIATLVTLLVVAWMVASTRRPAHAEGLQSRGRLVFGSAANPGFNTTFFNVWDTATLAALVRQCIKGGMQCDARGFDENTLSWCGTQCAASAPIRARTAV
jgi:hypothetical protein